MTSQGYGTLIVREVNVLAKFFGVLAEGCRHFDWLDNLREYIVVDDII